MAIEETDYSMKVQGLIFGSEYSKANAMGLHGQAASVEIYLLSVAEYHSFPSSHFHIVFVFLPFHNHFLIWGKLCYLSEQDFHLPSCLFISFLLGFFL